MEDDIFAELNSRAMLENKSFKDTVNDALRLGLGLVAAPPPVEPFEVGSFGGGLQPGIDPARLNQLADDLEIDAYLGGAARGAHVG